MRGIVYDDTLVSFRADELSNAFSDTVQIFDAVDLYELVGIGLHFVSQLVAKGTDGKWQRAIGTWQW